MTELDTTQNHFSDNSSALLATPESFDFELDHSMSDHDLLLHHVVEHDHSLYALDCCLGELGAM